MSSSLSIRKPLRTLIVDNYDSYTCNLYQYACTNDDPNYLPVVIRNDQFNWTEFEERILPHFDVIIISPGPGRPENKEDFGLCSDILLHANVPILGVCLGHQGLGHVYGGKVIHAPEPRHGRTSAIHHSGNGLFHNIPSPINVVRYHSLIVDATNLPNCLTPTAWTSETEHEGKILMAMQHVSKPVWSVQFHPESVCTDFGREMVGNFMELATEWLGSRGGLNENVSSIPEFIRAMNVIPKPLKSITSATTSTKQQRYHRYHIQRYRNPIDAQSIFTNLYSTSPYSFWLDSSKTHPEFGRFSCMGIVNSRDDFVLEYSALIKQIKEYRVNNSQKTLQQTHNLRNTPQTFLSFMSDFASTITSTQETDIHLPFGFIGGFIGYLGYEMKWETMGDMTHESTRHSHRMQSAFPQPDSVFLFITRFLVFDHVENVVYVVGGELVDNSEEYCQSEELITWFRETTQQLETIHNKTNIITPPLSPTKHTTPSPTPKITLTHPHKTYLSNIHTSLSKIKEGETYEVCLTTQLSTHLSKPSFITPLAPSYELYARLRNRNPAPYSGYLRFDNDFSIICSSPERFLKIEKEKEKYWVTMKPIKGTVKRDLNDTEEDERRRVCLENSEKDRAENLMIVDLIRNDLNHISAANTVHVPYLMKVESYKTVHQLVSTIKGQLREDLDAFDAISRSFPPGSMTGAPKRRTVEILEVLEGVPRGVYSGCLGYVSLNGCADMNVIIRTGVVKPSEDGGVSVSIGAGGAIVMMSDAEEEFTEMLLKANAVLPSIVNS